MQPQVVIPNPNPGNLPLDTANIQASITSNDKSKKASGTSKLPTQLVKHLNMSNDEVILKMFVAIASDMSTELRLPHCTIWMNKITDDT